MREIKFRAWDESCKRMFGTVTEIEFGNNPAFQAVYGPHTRFFWRAEDRTESQTELHQANDEDTVLMQFTGLRDKNGVEIYEGDIVRIQYGRQQTLATLKVAWVSDDEAIGWNLQDDVNTHYEVIGNVYEHPELVKEVV